MVAVVTVRCEAIDSSDRFEGGVVGEPTLM